jgi:hypothetical protein
LSLGSAFSRSHSFTHDFTLSVVRLNTNLVLNFSTTLCREPSLSGW